MSFISYVSYESHRSNIYSSIHLFLMAARDFRNRVFCFAIVEGVKYFKKVVDRELF